MKFNRQKQYITKNKDWKYIIRHNDVTRGLSKNAQDILFAVLYQIAKYGHAVLTHYELSQITETERRQNCRLLKQLGFVFDITFERSIVINEKKYRDCYIFTKNENTDKILENPVEYFANLFTKNAPTMEQKCPDIESKMSRSFEPLYIYTKKEIKINDNHDYQHNQFFNFNFFSDTECVETENIKVNNYKLGKVSVKGLAKEECQDTSQAKIQKSESVKTPIASDYVLGRVTETETKKRTATPPISTKTIETVGKDGNTYQSPYLRDFRFTDRMIDTAISRSNKKHYTHERVWVIIRNILERKPDKTVYGGSSGAINYLVKAIDGERDYEYEYKYPPTKEERAISMAEKEDAEQIALAKRYELLFQGKIKSISQAENYYG